MFTTTTTTNKNTPVQNAQLKNHHYHFQEKLNSFDADDSKAFNFNQMIRRIKTSTSKRI